MHSPSNRPVLALAWMMFLIPALGVPSELVLQDTLKSAILAFGVLISAWLFLWPLRQHNVSVQWHGLMCLPIALMVYALGSMVWSHTYLAAGEAIRWFVLGLLLWIGLNTLKRGTLPTLVSGIHGGVTVASIWAALQVWFDVPWFPQVALPASTFANRNFFAEFAVCALPYSAWLLANSHGSRVTTGVALSMSFNIVALLMTGTRSALLALMLLVPVLTVVLFAYRRQCSFSKWQNRDKTRVAATLLVVIVGLGSVPSDNPRLVQENAGTTALQRSYLRTSSIAEPKEYTEGSFSVRSLMWRATARMMIANPWMGVGAGAWEVQIPLYQRQDSVLETDFYAHNEYLQLLSEYGLLLGGLLLAITMAYLLQAVGITHRLQGQAAQERPARAMALASLMALGVVSNAGFPWHMAGTGALAALGLAIVASSDPRLAGQPTFFMRHLRWRPAYTRGSLVVLLGCAGFAVYVTARAGLAEYKLVHAIHIANWLGRTPQGDADLRAGRKAEMLQSIREGVGLNPHYRTLTAELAEPLAGGSEWNEAVWILETLVASRPHVTALWTGLAMGYSQLDQHNRARDALAQVQRLKPNATPTRTLEAILLSRAGQVEEAARRLNSYFDQGKYDYDMVLTAYAIGYQQRDWPLAIRAQKLRLATWQEHAIDANFRLGKLYAEPAVDDQTKALSAFQAGLDAVPKEQKDHYRSQVPQPYQARLQ